MITRNADNAATVHSADVARAGAAAQQRGGDYLPAATHLQAKRLQAQHLFDVCSDQLGLQMTFSHKVRDVDAIVESLLDAVVQHACGRSSQVASYILSPAALDDAVLNGQTILCLGR